MQDSTERSPIASSALSVVLTVDSTDAASEQALDDWIGCLNGEDREYELMLAAVRPEISTEQLASRCARARSVAPSAAGLGAALREALKTASHPLLCYAPCDRRFSPQELKKLFKLIDRVDLVVADREFPAHQRRSWRERGMRWLARLVFALRLRDVSSNVLLARRSIFARIPIQSDSEFAHLEILAKANFLGCLMSEAPVAYQPQTVQKSADSAAERQRYWADFRRLYAHPDFGPAFLAESSPPAGG